MKKLALLLALLAVPVPAAGAASAPGRTTFSAGLAEPQSHVDAGGATAAAALPGGGAVMAGADPRKAVVVAQVRGDGTLDPSFGSGGIARHALSGAAAPSSVVQVLRDGAGRILVVAHGAPPSVRERPAIVVLRLLPDGSRDPAYANAGVLTTGIQAACGTFCRPAAVAADGSLVIAGGTGEATGGREADPRGQTTFEGVVLRLTPSGVRDTSFSGDGSAELSALLGRRVTGAYAAALLVDGRVVVLGVSTDEPLLARLTPAGTADGSLGGSGVIVPPLKPALDLVARDDGTADVGGSGAVARIRPDGSLDPAFGSGGKVTFETTETLGRLLPDGDRGLLVYAHAGYQARQAEGIDMLVHRIAADGSFDEALGGSEGFNVRLGLGGGISGRFSVRRPLGIPPLAQSGSLPGEVVRRPDGTLLYAGGVRVARYTGEGSGHSTGHFAAAALTPSLLLDTRFAAYRGAPPVRVSVPRQSARSAYRLKRVLVRLRHSRAGLTRVRVTHGGRLVAHSLEPVFRDGWSSARVRLTRFGEKLLRNGRPRRLEVRATARDTATNTATAKLRATLR